MNVAVILLSRQKCNSSCRRGRPPCAHVPTIIGTPCFAHVPIILGTPCAKGQSHLLANCTACSLHTFRGFVGHETVPAEQLAEGKCSTPIALCRQPQNKRSHVCESGLRRCQISSCTCEIDRSGRGGTTCRQRQRSWPRSGEGASSTSARWLVLLATRDRPTMLQPRQAPQRQLQISDMNNLLRR